MRIEDYTADDGYTGILEYYEDEYSDPVYLYIEPGGRGALGVGEWRWVEGEVDGREPYGWGSRSYVGSLTLDEVAGHIARDYGGFVKVYDVE